VAGGLPPEPGREALVAALGRPPTSISSTSELLGWIAKTTPARPAEVGTRHDTGPGIGIASRAE
jgi:hypothetical protein